MLPAVKGYFHEKEKKFMNENRCAALERVIKSLKEQNRTYRLAALKHENARLKALLREALALIRDSVDCEYDPNSTVNECWGCSVTAQIEAALGESQ